MNQNREELITLVKQVQNASACVMDFDALMGRLEAKVKDKRIGELIFDPPGGKRLTAEEIVDVVLKDQK